MRVNGKDGKDGKDREGSAGGPPRASLYEHAGGEEALHRLEEIFYTNSLADPVLRTLFPRRRPHHVDRLTWFTAESFGGPDRFTRELGFGHLIDVHRNLKITDEQRERFAALYL
ncbi:globin domain-containing protein [Streptomyces sp. NPDC002853]